MSPSIKLGLLSLVSAAAAIPHSGAGGHSKFHSSKATGGAEGYGTGSVANPPPYPTGGWSGSHNHTRNGPTGGASTKDSVTTIIDTLHSTATVVSTVYATRPGGGNGGPNSVGAAGASSGGAAGGCGPATVYVTATNKVTVTVPAGGAPASSPGYASSAADVSSALPVGPGSSSKKEPSKVHSSKAEQPTPSIGGGYGSSAAPQGGSPSSATEKQLPSLTLENPKKEATKPASSAYTPPAVSPSKPASSAAASSAAAPSSTGGSTGGGYSGEKRGLAYTSAGDLSNFANAKLGFAYNWNPQPNGNMPGNAQFIPTVHPLTGAWATPENYLDLIKKQTNAKTLFTFNEPDKSDQANIDAGNFCDKWNNWIAPIMKARPDMTVVAPSVSNGNQSLSASEQGPPVGLYYLELVKQKCPAAASAWKEINIHFYDDYDTNTINRFKAYYENAAKLNSGKKIWVTELNVNLKDADSAPKFLKEVTSYLDSQANCAGYSWFKVGSESKRELLKPKSEGGGLSECGNAYVS